MQAAHAPIGVSVKLPLSPYDPEHCVKASSRGNKHTREFVKVRLSEGPTLKLDAFILLVSVSD